MMVDSGFELTILVGQGLERSSNFGLCFGQELADGFLTALEADRTLKLSTYLAENAGLGNENPAGPLGYLISSLVNHIREIYDGRSSRVQFEDFDEYIDDHNKHRYTLIDDVVSTDPKYGYIFQCD